MFFLKNISKSTWIDVIVKEDLCALSMSPVVENTLSHGTDVHVAGITKINIDTVERSEYL